MTQAEFDKLSLDEKKRIVIEAVIRLSDEECREVLRILNENPELR